MIPTLGNGKICYVEIPANDVQRSAEFYEIDTIIAHGGELVQPIGADAPEITARFRDPTGNVIGLYQPNR
jgi:uncharacterized protein